MAGPLEIRLILALLAGVGLVACAVDETATVDAPYEGEPWPVTPRPLVIPPGGLGLVTDSLSDTISAIDLGGGGVVATRVVGRNPVDIDGPHHIAVDRAGSAAYVALSYPVLGGAGPHAGHGGSQAEGWVQRLALADLSVIGQVRVDRNPGDIVVSEDGRRLVVTHFDLVRAAEAGSDVESARASIAVIDPATLAMTGSPAPRSIQTCVAPHGVALSRPDGATAFVACYGEDAVAIVDLASGEVERVPVGPGTLFGSVSYGPYAAALSPDGRRVAVSNLDGGDIRFLDVEARAMEDTPPIILRGAGYFPAWSADGGVLWVPTQSPDAILRVDLVDGTSVERPLGAGEGCQRPHEVERLDGDRLAIVCEGDHVAPGTVLVVDAATLETLDSVSVGVFPDAIERVRP